MLSFGKIILQTYQEFSQLITFHSIITSLEVNLMLFLVEGKQMTKISIERILDTFAKLFFQTLTFYCATAVFAQTIFCIFSRTRNGIYFYIYINHYFVLLLFLWLLMNFNITSMFIYYLYLPFYYSCLLEFW